MIGEAKRQQWPWSILCTCPHNPTRHSHISCCCLLGVYYRSCFYELKDLIWSVCLLYVEWNCSLQNTSTQTLPWSMFVPVGELGWVYRTLSCSMQESGVDAVFCQRMKDILLDSSLFSWINRYPVRLSSPQGLIRSGMYKLGVSLLIVVSAFFVFMYVILIYKVIRTILTWLMDYMI